MNRTFHDTLDGSQPCRREPEVFFPGQNTRGATSRAKHLCRSCRFQQRCLQYALAYDLYGVWGGATQEERRSYQHDRSIRPLPVIPPTIAPPTRKRVR